MAHSTQQDFISYVKNKFPNLFENVKVLEIGSLDINGTMRSFFSNCDYLGIDVGEGNGVDLVCQGQEYDAPDESYDVCTSGECFEHNPYWAETFANMVRMCKSNGLVLFTCATTGRKEHGTTRTDSGSSPLTVGIGWEYYKNLDEQDFRGSFEESFDEIFSEYEFHSTEDYDNPTDFIKNMRTYINPCEDLYFWGIKK
jgi:SAM-dependent methyltransferase